MLPNIQEVVERSIWHALNDTTIAEGYLPDVSGYDVENADVNIAKAAQLAYYEDMKTIRTDLGFAVEVFNNSTAQSKGNLKTPRIVIDCQSFIPGELGIDTLPYYAKQENDTYNKTKPFLSQTSDYIFRVRLLSSTTAQQRVLHGIMLLSLPRRGYLKKYTDETILFNQNLFCRYMSHNDIQHRGEGIHEKIFTYEIPDLVEVDGTVLANTPPITEITLNIPPVGLGIAFPDGDFEILPGGGIVIGGENPDSIYVTQEEFAIYKVSQDGIISGISFLEYYNNLRT